MLRGPEAFEWAVKSNLAGISYVYPVCRGDKGCCFESAYPCQSCGTARAGKRHIVSGRVDNAGNRVELQVCEDCRAYHASGKLPGKRWRLIR